MLSGLASSNSDLVEKAILLGMNEGVITLECTGNVFMVNPAALRILGLERNELEGRDFRSVLGESAKNKAFLDLTNLVLSKGSLSPHREIVFLRTDGQSVDLSVTGSSLDVDICGPQIQNVVLVFRDISALKSLERARIRAVNHLAHEITTPLSIIQASVQLLMRDENVNTTTGKRFDRIQRNIARLLELRNILEEIIDPVPYEPQELSLKTLLEAEMEKIQQESSSRSVNLKLKTEHILTDLIDPRIFSLAVYSLVKNAIENTPDEGDIMISTIHEGNAILLTVQDWGIGIPLAEQQFIFEAFHNTQLTDDYATKTPFQFNAGGKGLELFRLRVLSETSPYELSYDSERCRYIPLNSDFCPGCISQCPHISIKKDCLESGGSVFRVLFNKKS